MSRLRIFDEGEPNIPRFESHDHARIEDELGRRGIRFEAWTAAAPIAPGDPPEKVFDAYRGDIDRLMRLEGYQSFDAFTLIGFIIGMLSGSIVLTWLYLGTGGSILAVAIWHTLFNMATATAAATGVIASSVSAMVIALALVITPRLRRQGNMVPAASTAPPSADQPKP